MFFSYKQLGDVTQKLVNRKHFVSLCCNKCQQLCDALRKSRAAFDHKSTLNTKNSSAVHNYSLTKLG